MVMVMNKEKTQFVKEEEATDTEAIMVLTRAISGHGPGENWKEKWQSGRGGSAVKSISCSSR